MHHTEEPSFLTASSSDLSDLVVPLVPPIYFSAPFTTCDKLLDYRISGPVRKRYRLLAVVAHEHDVGVIA